MSKIVDERVVEMRFDNAQFERGVATSISTLDKLKAKLNFKDSSKGLEEVGRAANQVRFDGMIDGINTVNARFSYLQGTIQHQLNNIVDSCVTAGKRMVSALTTRPVKDGFAEYETQMNAVQTILANTKKEGTNVKMVNAALDELNAYADKTIYNFTEMTRNIGTFTAAGVKLNTSVSAIKGIANLAAVSGSTSQQASTAMYQLSQALAAGTVKLMDWNSVVNAGMGGQVFQDALIRTSEHLQTGANAAIAAKGSFRESLQTGWLTTEVLTETLDMFATAADTQEEYEAAVEKFVSKGYVREEAKQMADMAKTAGEAATKVKTFTQLTNTVKEALGSGWSTTWRLIIGDFDEAKSLWTSVNDVLSPIIEKMSNARNALLESALGKGFSDLSAKIKSCVAPAVDAANTVKKVGTAIYDLGAIVDDVILGKFGNGVDRFNALSEAGINYYEVQNKVNEKLNCSKRYTDEQIREQNRLLGITNDSTDATENQIDSTASLTEEQKKNLKELMKLNDEQLKAKGLTKEQIKALDELQSMSKKLGIPIDEFIDKLDQINGRWLLLEGFKNIGRAIAKVFSSISNAASEIFRALTPDDIFNVLAAFHKLTASLILNNENADKLKRTFKGLFAAIDIVRTILGGGFSIALRLVSTLLGNANMNILDLTARIGDAIVKLRDFLFNNELVNKGVDLLAKGFEKIGEVIGKVINILVHNPVTEKITSIWDNIFGGVNKGESGGMISAIKQIGDTLDLSGDKANNFKSIMEGVKNSLSIGNWQWTATLSSNIKLVNSVLSLFGTNMADVIAKVADAITWFGNWSNMHLMFVNSGAKLSEVLATIIKGIHDCVEAFMQLEPVQKFIQNLRATLSKFFGDMSNGINSISIDSFCNQLSKAFEQLQSWINSLKNSEHLGLDIVRGIVHGLQSGVSDAIGGIISIVTAIKDTFCSLFGIHSPSTWAIEMAGWIVKGFAIGFERAIDTIRTVVTNICNFFKGIFEEIGFNKIENPMSAIGLKIEGSLDIIKKYFSNFADFLKRLDLKQLLTLIPVGLVLITTKKLFDIVKVFETGLQSVNGVLDALKGAIGKFGGLADAYSKQVKSKAFRNIAISIGILVASVVALTYVDQDKLFTAVGVITVLAGILTALAFTMSKMESASVSIEKSGLKIDGVKSSLIAIGASILMLAASIKLIGSMNQNEFTRGLEGMATVVVSIVVLLSAISALGKVGDLSHAEKVGSMMLKISVSMLVLATAMKNIAKLSAEDMLKSVGFITAFGVFIGALTVISKFAGDSVSKVGSMMIKLSISLGLLVGVCKLISMLSAEEMLKGAAFATGFTIFVAALVKVTKSFPENGIKGLGRLILSISLSLGLLVGVCKLISMLSTEEMLKGAAFATGFLVFVKLLVRVTKISKDDQIAKVSATILAISIAIGALAAVSILMGLVDNKMLLKGVVAVAALGSILTAMIWATRGASECKANLTIMTTAIVAMSAAIVVLSLIDSKKLAGSTAALVSLMGAFALMEKMASEANNAWKSIILLTAVVAGLAGILTAMDALDTKNSLQNGTALSILLISMASSLKILDGVKNISLNALSSIAILGLVIGELAGIFAIMDYFDINPTIEIATSLSILLLTMTGVTAILSAVGGAATSAIVGALALVGVVTVIGGFITAIGALNQQFSQLEAFVNSGIPLLQAIGEGVGTFVGSIVAGFSGAILDIIPKLGTALSNFMNNISGFIDGAKNIDSSVLSGIGALSGAILALSGAEIVNSIATFVNNRQSLETFGSQLSAFIVAAAPFISGIKSVNESTAVAAQALGKTILAISEANVLAGIQRIFGFGSSSFEELGKELLAFGNAIVGFSDVVKGKIDGEAVTQAANAGQVMAELEKALSNKGGLWQEIVGSTDLKAFGEACREYGEAIVGFSNVITENGGINTGAVEQAANAGQLMSELESTLSNKGGLLQNIIGESDLANFGKSCVAFGETMIGFSKTIVENGGVDSGAIQQARDAGVLMNELVQAMPKTGGLLQDLVGAQDLAKFGEQCTAFGQAITEFANNTSADPEVANKAKLAGETMAELQKAIPEKHFFDGKVTLDRFGETISKFGNELSAFASTIADTDFETSTKPALACADSLMSLASNVQNIKMDGIDEFKKVTTIGNIVKNFSDKVQDISIGAVNTSVSAAKELQNFITGLVGLDYSGIEGFKVDKIGTAIKNYADQVGKIDTGSVISSTKAADKLADTIRNLAGVDSSLASQFSEAINTLAQANIEGFVTALSTAGPQVSTAMTTMMTTMSSTVISQSYVIIQAFNTMMTSVVAAITSRQSYFTTAGSTMMLGMSVGVNSGSAGVISAVSSAMNSIVSLAKARVTVFTSVGRQTMTYLRTGIANGAPNVISQINMIISNIKNRIISRSAEFTQAGRVLVSSLSGGIRAGGVQVTSAISSVLQGCSSAIRSYYYSFSQAGSYLGLGLVSGINSMQSAVYNAGYRLGLQAVAGEKAGQKSHSPSKATRKAGRWLGEGLIIGIKEVASSVYRTCKTVGKTASDSITEALSIVNNIDEWGIDTDPSITIHPVLDMSNIKSGINYIDGLLNTDKTIALSTGSGSVISTASVVNQNGNNSDVINAIDKLRKELTNTKVGNTYNLNGITYDDGSNVSNAIETLVRAANIERRR